MPKGNIYQQVKRATEIIDNGPREQTTAWDILVDGSNYHKVCSKPTTNADNPMRMTKQNSPLTFLQCQMTT